jgi:hypothetical protein
VGERARQIVEDTAAARGDVLTLASSLSAEQTGRPLPEGEWTVKDALAHLASIEARVRLMLATVLDGGAWTGNRDDLDAYNARCVEERHTWTADAILAELRSSGRETDALIGTLTDEQLDRAWDHPIFGPMTVERTARIAAGHLRNHLGELRAALQA